MSKVTVTQNMEPGWSNQRSGRGATPPPATEVVKPGADAPDPPAAAVDPPAPARVKKARAKKR